MAKYHLPDLLYDYGALEPHLSAEIMELHHDKHHRAYVDGANRTLDELDEARAKSDFQRLPALEHALAFHVSGHLLHSIFWMNLSPHGGGEPDGALGRLVARDFGSFAAFKAQLTHTAATMLGSGWAALVWDPVGHRLITAQLHDHQSETTQAGIPLLVVDAWEHAYYLQYRTDKTKYFGALWILWNWSDVTARLHAVE
ncbi:MAG: superoxide dismutase, partial [bacterium]|nr:superoxide dismutase [bacterium]